jgi:hypothetical protein
MDGRSRANTRAYRGQRPVGQLLRFDFAASDDIAVVDKALTNGCDVFHYAGHTDIADGRGTLVHRVRSATLREFDRAVGDNNAGAHIEGMMEAFAKPASWSDSEVLAQRLARGGTRLAVFNARR